MDSCLTAEHENEKNVMYYTNKIGRIFFHSLFLLLLCLTYYARSCTDSLYPPVFIGLGFFIFSQQVFDIALYYRDYLIDWERLPPKHLTGMFFNKELFREQMKILFYSNLLFGTFSLLTIWMGFTLINKNEENLEESNHLICYSGNLWVESTLLGTIFMMCH